MMPYIDLLKQKEWSQKCVSILNRDRYICQDCGHVGFHNGDESFMEVADIGEINKMFDGWKFDGLNFSDFISNFSQYECETPKAIILERERLQGNEELYNLKLWLYGQNTKYFCNAHSNKFTALSDYDLETTEVNAYILFNKISNPNCDISYSWIYDIEFPRKITNRILFSFNGKNVYNNSDSYFCEYEIKVISGYKMLLLLIITGKPIFKGLNIHHKYYIFGHNPWEYKDDALITLCEDCHRKRHESQNIPVYNENRDIIEYAKVCDRCHGSGYLPEYYHVQQGICFKCGGEGVVF